MPKVLKEMYSSEVQQWLRTLLGQSSEEMRQTKESLQEQERVVEEEKKELFRFLLRIVSDLEAELGEAATKRRDTVVTAAGKGLFPEVTEEVVTEVMTAMKKDANLSYQIGAKQTVMFDRVMACVRGSFALDV